MEDDEIVDLYWRREEEAITATSQKYGGFCHGIALNILSVREDAEECVNDTWCHAWNAIPPERPRKLNVWLGKITRNLALNRWQKRRAKKRYHGMEVLLDELAECIPAGSSPEQTLENTEITRVIEDWLKTLSREERAVFVRRYWGGEALGRLAKESGSSPERMKKRLYRLRQQLKKALEKEGIYL